MISELIDDLVEQLGMHDKIPDIKGFHEDCGYQGSFSSIGKQYNLDKTSFVYLYNCPGCKSSLSAEKVWKAYQNNIKKIRGVE